MKTTADVGNRSGKPPLTDEEKQAIADRWNANEAARPVQDWKKAMQASDIYMPRYMEDMIDVLPPAIFANLAQPTKDKHAAKKALRLAVP